MVGVATIMLCELIRFGLSCWTWTCMNGRMLVVALAGERRRGWACAFSPMIVLTEAFCLRFPSVLVSLLCFPRFQWPGRAEIGLRSSFSS
ncbi:hypothetical protein BC826DRAFT_1047865 [Russula brevipes]|nr:hypothetical protein BC826DRAFT_1047865 [Russula brevipes]